MWAEAVLIWATDVDQYKMHSDFPSRTVLLIIQCNASIFSHIFMFLFITSKFWYGWLMLINIKCIRTSLLGQFCMSGRCWLLNAMHRSFHIFIFCYKIKIIHQHFKCLHHNIYIYLYPSIITKIAKHMHDENWFWLGFCVRSFPPLCFSSHWPWNTNDKSK